MSICLKNPLTAIRQVVSFLPIPYWNTRHWRDAEYFDNR
jgi:hypothetical protein